MGFLELNYLAILVSAFIAFFVGWMWYGPLFGKAWMKLVKINEKEAKESMLGSIIGGLIATLIMATAVAYLIWALEVTVWYFGLKVGLLAGIGFVATYAINDVIYEKKPFPLFLIKVGYSLVALMTIGAIYTLWVS